MYVNKGILSDHLASGITDIIIGSAVSQQTDGDELAIEELVHT